MGSTTWSDKDLIEARARRDYEGYRICKTFYMVLAQIEEDKPTFYSLTFLQKDDSMKAIFTRREWVIGGCTHKVVREQSFHSKEEGNAFFLKVLATKKISKKHMIFYKA